VEGGGRALGVAARGREQQARRRPRAAWPRWASSHHRVAGARRAPGCREHRPLRGLRAHDSPRLAQHGVRVGSARCSSRPSAEARERTAPRRTAAVDCMRDGGRGGALPPPTSARGRGGTPRSRPASTAATVAFAGMWKLKSISACRRSAPARRRPTARGRPGAPAGRQVAPPAAAAARTAPPPALPRRRAAARRCARARREAHPWERKRG
jgi:hypothetical protein